MKAEEFSSLYSILNIAMSRRIVALKSEFTAPGPHIGTTSRGSRMDLTACP